MKRTLSLAALTLLVLVLLPRLFGADPVLEITVDVLEPTDQPGEIDPGIKYLKEEMSRSPLKFQNYLNLATAFRSIPLNQTATIDFNLRRHLELVIIPKKITERTSRFAVTLRSDGDIILSSELTLVKKGTVMIGASGSPNLIIAISEGF